MFDVVQLDADISFLKDEITNLKVKGAGWAELKARRFERIAETLRQVRQQQQMTGMNGGKI